MFSLVPSFTQHCPASCHLNPARRLLQALVQHGGSYGNELQFLLYSSGLKSTKPGSVTWGSVDPTVHVQSGLKDMMTQDAGV